MCKKNVCQFTLHNSRGCRAYSCLVCMIEHHFMFDVSELAPHNSCLMRRVPYSTFRRGQNRHVMISAEIVASCDFNRSMGGAPYWAPGSKQQRDVIISVLGQARSWDRPFKMLGACPILGQALQNSWDRPALRTGPSKFLGQARS